MARVVSAFFLALMLLLPGLSMASGEISLPFFKKDPDRVVIRLERLTDSEWALRYDLKKEVKLLDLGPPYGDMRTSHWMPGAGFEIVSETFNGETSEILRRTDGGAFTRVNLTLKSFDAVIPKQYVPFNTFSEGSVSVFSGQFVPNGLKPRFKLVPRSGESVVAGGAFRQGETVWEADHDAFLYFGSDNQFGSLEPYERSTAITLIDPQTPPWLLEKLNHALPALIAYYTEGFDSAPKEPPLLLIGARFDESIKGYSIKGGALRGQIQMRIRAAPILEPDASFSNMIFHFFAHESAHLFQDVSLATNETAWIHEGGADALALEAVERLGYYSKADVVAKREQARATCADGLTGTPLDQADDDGRFDLLYSCGQIMTELSVLHLQLQGSPDLSVVDFWGELAKEAHASDRSYTEPLYREVFQNLGGSWDAAEALSSFFHQTHEDGAAAIATLEAQMRAPVVERN